MNDSKYLIIEKKYLNRIFTALFFLGILIIPVCTITIPILSNSNYGTVNIWDLLHICKDNDSNDYKVFFYLLHLNFIPHIIIIIIGIIRFIKTMISGNDNKMISLYMFSNLAYIFNVIFTYNSYYCSCDIYYYSPGNIYFFSYFLIIFNFLIMVGYSILNHLLSKSFKENFVMLLFSYAKASLSLIVIITLFGNMFYINYYWSNFMTAFVKISAEDEYFQNLISSIHISLVICISLLILILPFIHRNILMNLLNKKPSSFSISSLLFNIFSHIMVFLSLFLAIILENRIPPNFDKYSAYYTPQDWAFIKDSFGDMFKDTNKIISRYIETKFFAIFIIIIFIYLIFIGGFIYKRIVKNNINSNIEKTKDDTSSSIDLKENVIDDTLVEDKTKQDLDIIDNENDTLNDEEININEEN